MFQINRLAIALFILLLLVATTFSQPALQDQAKRPAQIADLFAWKQLREVRLSPDGRWVAFTIQEANEKENRWMGDIWLVSTSEGAGPPVQVTRNPKNDYSPRWSPDGKLLAFLSVRGEQEEVKPQIFLTRTAGGEPEKITDHKSGVNSFAWSRDGKQLFFTANDPLPQTEEKRRKEKNDAKVVEKKFQYAHLYAIDLQTRNTRRITRGKYHISQFELSPNGQIIAFTAAPTPLLNYTEEMEVYTVSVNGGPRQQLTHNKAPESLLRWSPDGRWITFAADATKDGTMHYVAPSRLFAVPSQGGDSVPLMSEFETGLSFLGGYAWDPNSKYIDLLINKGVTNTLVHLEVSEKGGRLIPGKQYILYNGERLMGNTHRDRSGKWMAFSLQDPSTPPDVYFAKAGQPTKARRLTHLNPQIRTLQLARHEVVHWQSNDGQQVEGILYYPLDYEKGKPVPLITTIHGGPFGADKISFMMSYGRYPHINAAYGYATLYPNYRGSSSYGDEFGREIVGHYYEKDVADILSGIDALIARGIGDKDRLGVKGWSAGGILSAWLTTETDRFKAAAPGAGDVNWISDFGNADIGVPFDREYFGGLPWENLEHYIEKSPIFRMERVTTPTLIFFGEKDVRVPVGQGFEHFRTLKELGKPVEFVLFPREGHGLRELKHQRTKVQKELAWFDKYVLGRKERPQPLAAPLVEHVAKVGGLYGKMWGEVLIPETVRLTADTLITTPSVASLRLLPTEGQTADTTFVPSFTIGRFEVTNAQYQLFLQDNPQVPIPVAQVPFQAVTVWNARTRKFKSGYANHPVVGVTAEEAVRYCQWLSKKTGQKYRIPTTTQWEFAARAGTKTIFPWGGSFDTAKCNSASKWAGETVYDAAEFFQSEKSKKLLEQRLPTQQAGSYSPNEWSLYDMSGNAWEWCQGDSWVACGGSWTSTPSELRVNQRLVLSPQTRRNDVGFRVVLVE